MIRLFKRIFTLFLVLSIGGLTGTSCKKKREFNSESAQTTIDVRMMQGECDEVIKDANIALMEDYRLRGESSAWSYTTSLCGVSLDTSKVKSGEITLIYKGVNCYGRTRNGRVKISIRDYPGMRWKNGNAVAVIQLSDYSMTRSSDNRMITLNGTIDMHNESGGSWHDLWHLSQPQVVYRVSASGITAGFTGTGNGSFNFDRRLKFTYTGGVTTCVVDGLGSAGSKSGLENWGDTPEGQEFTTEILQTPVWKSECGAMAPHEGAVSVKVKDKPYELKCFYGVNSSGDASGDKCPFGWRVEWSRKKRTNTRVFGYY